MSLLNWVGTNMHFQNHIYPKMKVSQGHFTLTYNFSPHLYCTIKFRRATISDRSEAVRYLLELDEPAPAGVTDKSGQSAIVWMITKMPGVVSRLQHY